MNIEATKIKIIDYILNDLENGTDRSNVDRFILAVRKDWAKSKGHLSSPLWVGWKITSKCNISCKHCWAKLNGEDRDTDKMKDVIDKFYNNNIFHVTITGGEPMIRNDFFEIVRYLKDKKIHLELFTNGWFLNYENSKKLANILSRYDTIQISLDGFNEKTHDSQRMKGSYKKVIEAFKNISKFQIKTRLNFTATHLNVEELYDTFMLANELKIDVFSASPVYPSGKGRDIFHMLNQKDFLEQISRCIDQKNKLETYFRPFLPITIFSNSSYEKNHKSVDIENIHKIEEGDLYWSIDANGDVYPSIDLYYNELCGGNIYDNEIEEIQSNLNENFNKFRNLKGTKCEQCNFLHLCEGGNLGRTFNKYKHFNMPDPICKKGVV
ncbi:radical SAM protein [Bacillus sp. A301a_S52]|jgi:radical SAM protein with 4Fe4S-binding SPASM domain|nr:radical SAM protein [Bacillus sp. A301a_S52]